MAKIKTEKLQKNLSMVFHRLAREVMHDPDLALHLAPDVEELLDEYASDDGFGTERQCDPRGDFRNRDDWSIFGEIQ